MLKKYLYNGKEYQFEESEAPAVAVLLEKKKEPENKEANPKNKRVKK